MAAPVKTMIQLPTDAGNTGKKVQTQSEVQGADTVHSHFYVPRSRRKLAGVYMSVSAVQSVVAAAHTNNTGGFLWLQLPAGSTVAMRLRRLTLSFSATNTTVMPTVPRIMINRFSFTGTASGATQSVAKRMQTAVTGDTVDAAMVTQIRTAITGMTCTYEAAGIWGTTTPASQLLTSGYGFAGFKDEFDPVSEDEYPIITAGEGLVLWQPDAATASDSRRFTAHFLMDEFDNA